MRVVFIGLVVGVIVSIFGLILIPWVSFLFETLWPKFISIDRYYDWCLRVQNELKDKKSL